MNKKRLRFMLSIIGLIVALTVLMSACAQPAPAPTPAPAPSPVPAPAPQEPEKVYKWKFFETQGGATYNVQVIVRKLIDNLYNATDGQLQIEMFLPGEHPYGYGTVEKALRDNECQLAEGMDHAIGSSEPGLDMNILPFMFPDLRTARKAYNRALDEVISPILLDKWNTIKIVTYFYPPQAIHGHEALTSFEALKGEKIRTWGGKAANLAVEAIGAAPVSVDYGEVPSALQTKVIDAAITSIQGAYDGKWYDSVKHTTELPLFECNGSISVNKDALAELPDELRATFWHVVADLQKWSVTGLREYNMDLKGKASKEYGVTFHQPSPEFINEVRDRIEAAGIWEEVLETAGPTGQKIYQIFLEEVEKGT